ncbi:unnamed protein product [Closterium sp. NIES-54]
MRRFSPGSANSAFLSLAVAALVAAFAATSHARVLDFGDNKLFLEEFSTMIKVDTRPAIRAASAANCQPSTLPDFASAVTLSHGLVLHWTPATSGGSVSMAVEAPASAGWISVAFSSSGTMAPSDAVIGNADGGAAVQAYSITGYDMGSVKPSGKPSLGSAGLTKSGDKIIMKFSRSEGDGGSVAFKSGKNKLIWATSSGGSTTLGYHGSNL